MSHRSSNYKASEQLALSLANLRKEQKQEISATSTPTEKNPSRVEQCIKNHIDAMGLIERIEALEIKIQNPVENIQASIDTQLFIAKFEKMEDLIAKLQADHEELAKEIQRICEIIISESATRNLLR